LSGIERGKRSSNKSSFDLKTVQLTKSLGRLLGRKGKVVGTERYLKVIGMGISIRKWGKSPLNNGRKNHGFPQEKVETPTTEKRNNPYIERNSEPKRGGVLGKKEKGDTFAGGKSRRGIVNTEVGGNQIN